MGCLRNLPPVCESCRIGKDNWNRSFLFGGRFYSLHGEAVASVFLRGMFYFSDTRIKLIEFHQDLRCGYAVCNSICAYGNHGVSARRQGIIYCSTRRKL